MVAKSIIRNVNKVRIVSAPSMTARFVSRGIPLRHRQFHPNEAARWRVRHESLKVRNGTVGPHYGPAHGPALNSDHIR